MLNLTQNFNNDSAYAGAFAPIITLPSSLYILFKKGLVVLKLCFEGDIGSLVGRTVNWWS